MSVRVVGRWDRLRGPAQPLASGVSWVSHIISETLVSSSVKYVLNSPLALPAGS